MPIYEYRCEACNHELEALQKISDDPLSQCPECKKDHLKKRVSAAAFRLKGSGWYETDFKSGNKKNIAGSSEKNSDASSAKESSKEGGASTSDSASKTGNSTSSDTASSSGKPSNKKAD